MKVINGVLADVNIPGITFQADLIPVSHKKARPGIKMTPRYITVHNTGSPGGTALAHANYIKNLDEYKSWHFTVDNKNIVQHLPVSEIGYHAGDGKGPGNYSSIGIEICEIDGSEEIAIQFIAQLLMALNMDMTKIKAHKDWSGKNCPRLILPHWKQFISDIEYQYNINYVQLKTGFNAYTIDYLKEHKWSRDLFRKLKDVIK